MPVTFNQCPSCKSMILPDTPVCPTCKHVLHDDALPATEQAMEAVKSTKVSSSDLEEEVECSSCGELVRSGLVRCWNCGGFMREDIAKAYREMKSRPQEVIYSPESLQDLQEQDGDIEAYDFEEHDEEGFELAADVSSSDSFVLPSTATSAPSTGIPQTPVPQAESAPPAAVESPAAPEAAAETEAAEADAAEEAAPVAEAEASGDETASEGAEEASDKSAPADKKRSSEGDASDVDHSEATGADVLLNIAMEEERETGKRKLRNLPRGMFIVYCPKGHRIRVRDKHRGLTGRCPVCKTAFYVPKKEEPQPAGEEAAAQEGQLEEGSTDDKAIVTGDFSGWMADSCQHRVDPGRLKLRPGSLSKEFIPVDLAFSKDGLLICELSKPGALFGGGPKKNPAIREEIHEHLRQGLAIDKLPGHQHRFFSTENFAELRIVQPCPEGQVSLFHGIPVFGEARIAVQIPRMDESSELEFLSFNLSQFREFVAGMRELCGHTEFAAGVEVPLTESYEMFDCHYTKKPVPALDQTDYYKADESFELITVGYQCEHCGLVMSEEGRAAEKFGGAKAKSIAKAKCPSCEQKFGSMVLEAIKDDPILTSSTESEEEGAEEDAAMTDSAADDATAETVAEADAIEEASAETEAKAE